MRWGIFVIFAFIAVVVDVSVGHVLEFRALGIWPSCVAVLLVYVSLFAPRHQAIWACWAVGLIVDLCADLPQGTSGVGALVGPHALGYPFGCFVLLQVRAMLFRRRVLTIAVTTVAFATAAAVVAIFLYVIHGWYPTEQTTWADHRPAVELARRFAAALYSGVLALVLARPLVWTSSLWGFRTQGRGATAWRGAL